MFEVFTTIPSCRQMSLSAKNEESAGPPYKFFGRSLPPPSIASSAVPSLPRRTHQALDNIRWHEGCGASPKTRTPISSITKLTTN
jgi:hypothetical protein